LLNPTTRRPCEYEDLIQVFCDDLVKQELDNDTPYFDIPQEIKEYYKTFRPSPLYRAYRLKKA
jgi:tryptophan synthase beta chain